LYGGLGLDTLTGGENDDTMEGGAGADLLLGDGRQSPFGGDFASYAGAATGVRADLADPTLNTGDAAGDQYVGILHLLGSAFNDRLAGDDNWSIIWAGAGDDTLEGRGEFDQLYGQEGRDSLSGGDGGDWLTGGTGDDTLDGGDGEDVLSGGDGNDVLDGELSDGEAGNDTLTAIGGGFSVLSGGPGNDLVIGNDDNGAVAGGPGTDTLTARGGIDILYGGEGPDRMDGGAGSDTALYRSPVRADLSNPATNTGEAFGDTYVSIENLEGSSDGDILKGNNSANRLFGFEGDDRLIGGGGGDLLDGSRGNDTLTGEGGHDTINGSYGADLITGGASGRDIFTFELVPTWPTQQFNATVTDFEDGVDAFRLRWLPADGGPSQRISFDDVTVTQQGAHVRVSIHLDSPPGYVDSVILIRNELAANITAADFIG
jgi:serralysin